FVSTNAGKAWTKHGQYTVADKHVEFTAPRDGMYWFTLQVELQDGKFEPARREDLRPAHVIRVTTKQTGLRLPLGAAVAEAAVARRVIDAAVAAHGGADALAEQCGQSVVRRATLTRPGGQVLTLDYAAAGQKYRMVTRKATAVGEAVTTLVCDGA